MDIALEERLYALDTRTRRLLQESAPLMAKWARSECTAKPVGGMEEWAKEHAELHPDHVACCDWYHGTWQYLRLLNMVAVPPWYEFYNRALSGVLRRRPHANVLISACADYGMLATLHDAIESAGADPQITIYDICSAPLLACEWYASRHGLNVKCVRDNIITSPSLTLGAYDLIVTDEFLTVLKSDYKPLITKRWAQLLKPDGTVVTTAMIGGPTTAALREGYVLRANHLFEQERSVFEDAGLDSDDVLDSIGRFAAYHTRHMVAHEGQIRALFSDYDLSFSRIVTPGECVNPTSSFQITAALRPDASRAG
jgi:hypothetical protein